MKPDASNRNSQPSDRLVAEAAWLYYIKGFTQGEVAKKLGISRPTVISYIRLSKDRGLVNFKIDPVHMRTNELSDQLCELFNLNSAHVVVAASENTSAVIKQVSEAAAHALPNWLSQGDELGVSWGETLSYVAEATPKWPIDNLVVRQLIGSMANPLLDTAESCTTEIAKRLSGYCVNLNAPAVCSTAALSLALRNEPIISQQLMDLSRCNKSIFSVSPCTQDTHVVHFKVATRQDIKRYKEKGAVGILVGRFLDAQGQHIEGELDERLLSVNMDSLLNTEGMLVVSGASKLKATLAALRGGYVKRIVTDASLAENLLRTQKRES